MAVVSWLPGPQLRAHQASGDSVSVVSSVGTAGLIQKSASYEVVGFVGQAGSVTTSASGTYSVRGGPIGMLVSPVGFAVVSAETQVNEAGATPETSTRVQLSGAAVNDDGTQDRLPATAITWTPPLPGGAIASISPEGLASFAAVYQDTTAFVSGTYGGISATNFFLVRNVLNDNFGALAGDTFDDAWSVSRGITNALDPNEVVGGSLAWMLYAMGLDPRTPAQTPVRFAMETNGYLSITYTRNPAAANHTFRVEESAQLTQGFSELANPVSSTNHLPDGTQSITTRASTPMNSTTQQFLRVRIGRPAN